MARISYYGNNVGNICCRKFTVPKNHVFTYFYFYAFNIPRGYIDTDNNDGTAGSGPRNPIYGAIWYSKPSSVSDKPDVYSKETYNLGDYPQIPSSKNWPSDTNTKDDIKKKYPYASKLEFNFDTDQQTKDLGYGYIGIYTPYGSPSDMGFIKEDSGITGIRNYGTAVSEITTTARSNMLIQIEGVNSTNIVPKIQPASILITNWSPIANHNTNNSAFVTWNGVSNQSSSVVASANGNNKTYSNGDPSNTDRRKPADVSVGSGSQFVYKVTRSNALPSSDTDQVTVYTYTYPSINNLKYESPSFTKDKNIINANHLLKLSWESNSPLCDSKSSSNKKGTSKSTSDKHKTILKIKDSNTTEVDNTSTGTSVQKSANIPATSIQKYVPFDSSKPLGEEVTLTLTKSHANDDSIQKSILNKKLTVRYIPTEEIIWPTENKQTGFTLNHPYPTGAILQENSVVDKDPNNSVWVSFSYPSGEYGIVNGYEVRVKSQDGTWFGPYTYPTNPRTDVVANVKADVRIPTSDIKFGMQNKVYVRPFYLHTDGQRYYGPEVEKGFPSIITKLSTPSIIYPAASSEWINKNYRVLFTLPSDGDWSDYTDSIKNSYSYRDIQIKINNTVTFSYKNNPEIFSIKPLSPHKAKIVINPSLMSTYPNSTSYTFQVRVRKNYGYLDSQEEASWSLWSAARTLTVKPASFNVSKGDYIMASHYNLLKPLMLRMRNTYPDYTISTTTVSVGDYIEAEGFVNPYKDILQCFNLVNGWGTYHKDRSSVKFNKGINIPKFEPVVGEYITAMREDKIYNLSPGIYDGRNYIGIMFDDANLCK